MHFSLLHFLIFQSAFLNAKEFEENKDMYRQSHIYFFLIKIDKTRLLLIFMLTDQYSCELVVYRKLIMSSYLI